MANEVEALATIETAALYLEKLKKLQDNKLDGSGYTVDLDGDFFVVTKEE